MCERKTKIGKIYKGGLRQSYTIGICAHSLGASCCILRHTSAGRVGSHGGGLALRYSAACHKVGPLLLGVFAAVAIT